MKALTARRLAALIGTPGRDEPLYRWLATEIKLLTSDGRVPVGVRLPSEREFALALGMSRTTVTAAYRELRGQGWSSSRTGAGSWTRLPQGTVGGNWVPAPFDDHTIDFTHAAAAASPELATAFDAALGDLAPFLSQHGYHPTGLPVLRHAIAEHYSARGLPTTAEQILVTNGGIHALSIALSTLLRRGELLLIEHPSYPNAIDTARVCGARLLPVSVDPTDVDESINRMIRVLLEVRPSYAYLMPDIQNPTGLYLDGVQRRRLARGLLRAGSTPIVDETFADMTFDGTSAPPFGVFSASAISLGSLSKLVWGGLRIGWLRASVELTQQFAATAVHSNPSGSVIEQLVASHLLPQIPSILAMRRVELARAFATLERALAAELPRWELVRPAGGCVAWCKLPGPYSTALTNAASGHGLRLAPGPRFGIGHAFEDRLRLPFVSPPEVLRRGVHLLAMADRELADRGTPPSNWNDRHREASA